MAELFASGRIVDAILVLMLCEALALLAVRRRRRRGMRLPSVIFNLGAGAALLLALRASLVHARWPVTALWLMAALVGHLGEMSLRWNRD